MARGQIRAQLRDVRATTCLHHLSLLLTTPACYRRRGGTAGRTCGRPGYLGRPGVEYFYMGAKGRRKGGISQILPPTYMPQPLQWKSLRRVKGITTLGRRGAAVGLDLSREQAEKTAA